MIPAFNSSKLTASQKRNAEDKALAHEIEGAALLLIHAIKKAQKHGASVSIGLPSLTAHGYLSVYRMTKLESRKILHIKELA